MKMKKRIYKLKDLFLLLLIGAISFISIAATSGEGGKNNGNKTFYKSNLDYHIFDINNLWIPMDNKGVLGAVQPPGATPGGKLDNIVFLFSGGFFLSGLHNGEIWANGVMSASLVTDYQAGPVGTKPLDPKHQMYVVSVQDPAFGKAWDDWAEAVALGADYYDGNGNGIYDPKDENGNGIWDPTEDRPDLIGDITIWCVYNDGVPKPNRRYNDVDPKGIEVHQSVYGFASKGVVGNMMFVRYRLINKGTVADKYDSVYFAITVDPDLGEYTDDLVGCDTILSCGYTYQTTPDAQFGPQPPCFLVDFFQGPISYIPGETFVDVNGNGVYDPGVDTPLDTAYNRKGKVMGIDTLPGAKNLPLTSFTQYMQSHPSHGDPNTRFEVRNYHLGGRGKNGDPINACSWEFGNGSSLANCADIDPKFMYSGNPYAGTGWLNTTPIDQRQMSNTGPFVLEKDHPIDIVAVYLVARGTSPVNGVRVAKDYAKIAQLVFDNNFPSPPPPPPIQPVITTGEGFIDIVWPTSPHVNYNAIDTVLDIDRRVQGYYVSAFRTNSKSLTVSNVENITKVGHYSIDNFIKDFYIKEQNGGIVLKKAAAPILLDPVKYGDPDQGRLRLRITKDPFTDGPLIKGKEYYFAVANYTLNHKVIKPKAGGSYGTPGDYIDETNSAFDEYETAVLRVTYGKDLFNPALTGDAGTKASGGSKGSISYLVVDKEQLTGDQYSVEFFPDKPAVTYVPFWRLKNVTKNVTLIDSQKIYSTNLDDISGVVTDGFITKVSPIIPELDVPKYSNATTWYKAFQPTEGTGVYYVGLDTLIGSDVREFQSATIKPRSTVVSPNDLRRIELRFDPANPGKAYRYIHDFRRVSGYSSNKINNYSYAGGLWAMPDVVAQVGLKDPNTNIPFGYVDVPFTAWIVDDNTGDAPKQLAVGFVERKNSNTYPKANPDGIWDPSDSLRGSGEIIIIFNSPYDPNGQQFELTGGVYTTAAGTTDTLYTDLLKIMSAPRVLPDTAIVNGNMLTKKQVETFNSPWLNALYVVGFSKKDAASTWGKETLELPLKTYPYQTADKYSFTTVFKGAMSEAAEKDLFNKVNVFPNPLFAYNPATSFDVNANPDDPFVTFSNLPREITIKIFTLSGLLIRTLTKNETTPFLRWDLQNEAGLRVASGMYLAIVSSPKFGEKVLKFGVIMPQKQLQRY